MKKKFIYHILIVIALIIVFALFLVIINTQIDDTNTTITSDTDSANIKNFSIDKINISDSRANLIFSNNIDGYKKEELIVKKGDKYTFKKAGTHEIEVLELTDEYIIISATSLAPTKNSGGFSLKDKYDKIKIKANTGICLNVQATDITDGSIYVFYINH